MAGLRLSAEADPRLIPLASRARNFIDHARAPRTTLAYGEQWERFVGWCAVHALVPMPASGEAVALYLAACAERGLAMATMDQALCAIAEAHRVAGHPSPRDLQVVRDTYRGIRRLHGRPQRPRAPLLPADIHRMLREMPNNLRGTRDRALLLLGFLGAFRRSELVAVSVEHIRHEPDGLVVQLYGTKDDRELVGRVVAIPRNDAHLDVCPARALHCWLVCSGITRGPVFRSVNRHGGVSTRALDGKDVARIVKAYAEDAGIDPAELSGHSLRAGFVTSAHMAGAPLELIMKVTGHRSYDAAMRYVRRADMFRDHPGVGLL